MKITQEHPDFTATLVYLDGRLLKTCISADDSEGWVEVLDIAAMSPLDENVVETTESEKEVISPWERLPTKRRWGKVEFKKISQTPTILPGILVIGGTTGNEMF